MSLHILTPLIRQALRGVPFIPPNCLGRLEFRALAAVAVLLAVAAPAAGQTLTSGKDTYVDSFDGVKDTTGGASMVQIPDLRDVCFGAVGLACGSIAPNDGRAPAAGSDNAASGLIAGDDLYGVKWDTNIGLTSSINEGLIWFDISPAQLAAFQATPGSATLHYFVEDDGSDAALHRMTADWLTPDGDMATWNSLGCGGGLVTAGSCNAESASSGTASGGAGAQSVDVTADVLAWAGGAPNYGWGFLALGGIRTRLDTFGGANPPTLVFAPSTAWPASAGIVIAQEGATSSIPSAYEPSGAVWHTRLDLLLTVGDSGQVTEMTRDGVIVANWQPGGDLEGIAVADPQSDLVYLALENPDSVLEFDLSTGLLTGDSWDLTAWLTGSANQGLEALTYVDGLFYAGLQADGNVYVFDLQPGGLVTFIQNFPSPSGRTDLSGLHYEPRTGILYSVHDNFNIMVEMQVDGTFIREFDLPGDTQEGVTLDPDCKNAESSVFIAEDAGEFVRYDSYPSACTPRPPVVPAVPASGLIPLSLLLATAGSRGLRRRA